MLARKQPKEGHHVWAWKQRLGPRGVDMRRDEMAISIRGGVAYSWKTSFAGES